LRKWLAALFAAGIGFQVEVVAAATITVATLNDSGPGSLRAALASAADGDTVNFSVTGTITLTSGELLVNKSLAILGPGPANLALDGNAASRVLRIAPSNTVTIADLTVTNGRISASFPDGYGGGLYNDRSTLTLSNCTLHGNSAAVAGGGHLPRRFVGPREVDDLQQQG
jgi:hypothetical protein